MQPQLGLDQVVHEIVRNVVVVTRCGAHGLTASAGQRELDRIAPLTGSLESNLHASNRERRRSRVQIATAR